MNFFKHKMTLLSPVVVLIVALFFNIAAIPTVNPTPKNMPIAIVNEEEGIFNVSGMIIRNVIKKTESLNEKNQPVKWVILSSKKEALQGLNNQKYYGLIVFPKNLSEDIQSLESKKPIHPEVNIYINQGLGMIASNAANQALTNIIDLSNDEIRSNFLKSMKKGNISFTSEYADSLFSPISKKVIYVNKVGSYSANGNAPFSLTQPLWMTSMIGAIISYLTVRKMTFKNKMEKLKVIFSQIIWGFLLSIFIGFAVPIIAVKLIDFHIPHLFEVCLFSSIVYFSFYLMVLSVFSWIGMIATTVFGSIFFFGLPLMNMPVEFIPEFFRKWIYPWIPMRFSVDGLRELLYFNKTLGSLQSLDVLLGILIGSFLILILSILKNKKTP